MLLISGEGNGINRASEGIRTPDLSLTKRPLCRLSYAGLLWIVIVKTQEYPERRCGEIIPVAAKAWQECQPVG